jgi:thiosulfate dehydrogenase
MRLLRSYWWILVIMLIVVIMAILFIPSDFRNIASQRTAEGYLWDAPEYNSIPATPEGDLIRYGKELNANTSIYLGPKGNVASISNGMNCQNCHLEAGTKYLGNNYSAVYSTYPRFRARSGSIENIYKRINDCLERSLDGKCLDTNSREMNAMKAYILWLGRSVPKNVKPAGSGIADIPILDRAADPVNGQAIYMLKCRVCHGANGEGQLNLEANAYVYPPLWGKYSYNTAAGLFRISRFAGYVRYNMPYKATQKQDIVPLTDDEAWDVAAFVNSQPRPQKKFEKDWPDISKKPFDHPFGPYTDSFPELQHKFGPFGEMKKQ